MDPMILKAKTSRHKNKVKNLWDGELSTAAFLKALAAALWESALMCWYHDLQLNDI